MPVYIGMDLPICSQNLDISSLFPRPLPSFPPISYYNQEEAGGDLEMKLLICTCRL